MLESPSASFVDYPDSQDKDMDVEDASDFHLEDNSDATTCPTVEPTSSRRRQRCHSVSHRKQQEAWERVRPGLLQCFTTSLAMPTQQLCMYCSNSAEYMRKGWDLQMEKTWRGSGPTWVVFVACLRRCQQQTEQTFSVMHCITIARSQN